MSSAWGESWGQAWGDAWGSSTQSADGDSPADPIEQVVGLAMLQQISSDKATLDRRNAQVLTVLAC